MMSLDAGSGGKCEDLAPPLFMSTPRDQTTPVESLLESLPAHRKLAVYIGERRKRDHEHKDRSCRQR